MATFLTFADDQPFATGMVRYDYRPATQHEDSLRLVLQIEIDGVRMPAVVDTGAPFVVCTPQFVKYLSVDPTISVQRKTMLIRGSWVTGYLYRLPITFLAEQGEDLYVDATVFAPDPEWEEGWAIYPRMIASFP
jgi:hypothetical protein